MPRQASVNIFTSKSSAAGPPRRPHAGAGATPADSGLSHPSRGALAPLASGVRTAFGGTGARGGGGSASTFRLKRTRVVDSVLHELCRDCGLTSKASSAG